MLPKEIRPSWKTCRSFVATQKKNKKFTHQGIQQLSSITFRATILSVDPIQKKRDFWVITCLKMQICSGMLIIQCLLKKRGHQVVGRKLIPEDLLKGAGADHVIQQDPVIRITRSGMDNRRRNHQYSAGLHRYYFVLKIHRAFAGQRIVDFEIRIGMPMGRKITEHSAYSDVVIGQYFCVFGNCTRMNQRRSMGHRRVHISHQRRLAGNVGESGD